MYAEFTWIRHNRIRKASIGLWKRRVRIEPFTDFHVGKGPERGVEDPLQHRPVEEFRLPISFSCVTKLNLHDDNFTRRDEEYESIRLTPSDVVRLGLLETKPRSRDIELPVEGFQMLLHFAFIMNSLKLCPRSPPAPSRKRRFTLRQPCLLDMSRRAKPQRRWPLLQTFFDQSFLSLLLA